MMTIGQMIEEIERRWPDLLLDVRNDITRTVTEDA